MAKIRLRESQTSMRLELNLKEITGRDVLGKDEIKEAAAQKAIDIILDRTSRGKFLRNSSKKGYSKSYINSQAFKAAGKSPTPVNLKLTGDMLGTLSIIDMSGNSVTLGWEDDIENAKAFNHNTGDTLPRRTFFDLTNDEIDEIKKHIMPMFEESAKKEAREILKSKQKNQTLDDIVDAVTFVFDEGETA